LPPADVVVMFALSLLAACALIRTAGWWWPLGITLAVGSVVFTETATRSLRRARRRQRDLRRWQRARGR
jgi:membrane protein implicated in regulation of membrane protease activity